MNTGVTEGGRACQWPWGGAAEPSGWEWARVWKAAFPTTPLNTWNWGAVPTPSSLCCSPDPQHLGMWLHLEGGLERRD